MKEKTDKLLAKEKPEKFNKEEKKEDKEKSGSDEHDQRLNSETASSKMFNVLLLGIEVMKQKVLSVHPLSKSVHSAVIYSLHSLKKIDLVLGGLKLPSAYSWVDRVGPSPDRLYVS